MAAQVALGRVAFAGSRMSQAFRCTPGNRPGIGVIQEENLDEICFALLCPAAWPRIELGMASSDKRPCCIPECRGGNGVLPESQSQVPYLPMYLT
jgi:hypothetical protein